MMRRMIVVIVVFAAACFASCLREVVLVPNSGTDGGVSDSNQSPDTAPGASAGDAQGD